MQFQNCLISINNVRIMAERVSISESNKISASYSIGASSSIGHKQEGPFDGSIRIDYFIETNNEPNYSIVTGLKVYQSNHNAVGIVIAGAYFSGFLSSYSFNLSPNSLIPASVEYNYFSSRSGQFLNVDAGYTGYNTSQGSGLAHYWTSIIVNNNITGEIIEAGYSFNVNWEPKYKIGKTFPYAVSFLSAEEKIEIMSEYDGRIYPTGEALTGFNSALSELRLGPISGLYKNTNHYLSFPVGSARIVQSTTELSNNVVTNNISAFNSY